MSRYRYSHADALAGGNGTFWARLGEFGRARHLTKSKLELAIESHASQLGDAQRELVMSQFSVYKSNKARLSEIGEQLRAVDSMRATTLDEVRLKQANRASLSYEHNQLSTSNSQIAAELFKFLEER